MCSHVKGVDMIIIDDEWTMITRLKNLGRVVRKGNIALLEGFNKVEFFRSCLRNPHVATRGYHVGMLSMNPRILAFIEVWQLILKGYSHVVLTKEYLILMYCIMHCLKINWVNVIKEQMVKTRKMVDYCIRTLLLYPSSLSISELIWRMS